MPNLLLKFLASIISNFGPLSIISTSIYLLFSSISDSLLDMLLSIILSLKDFYFVSFYPLPNFDPLSSLSTLLFAEIYLLFPDCSFEMFEADIIEDS